MKNDGSWGFAALVEPTTTVTGNVFGFDANGDRWGMKMTFEAPDFLLEDWNLLKESAADIAAEATMPTPLNIRWTNLCTITDSTWVNADLMIGTVASSLPVGMVELYECPVPTH